MVATGSVWQLFFPFPFLLFLFLLNNVYVTSKEGIREMQCLIIGPNISDQAQWESRPTAEEVGRSLWQEGLCLLNWPDSHRAQNTTLITVRTVCGGDRERGDSMEGNHLATQGSSSRSLMAISPRGMKQLSLMPKGKPGDPDLNGRGQGLIAYKRE